jgi:hypothetical protein
MNDFERRFNDRAQIHQIERDFETHVWECPECQIKDYQKDGFTLRQAQ